MERIESLRHSLRFATEERATIQALPKNFLSGSFEFFAGGRRLGCLRVAPWRDIGVFYLDEDRYEVSRKGWSSLAFEISKNGEELGRARQAFFLSGSYDLEIDGAGTYHVEPKRPFDVRSLKVSRGALPVGEISGQNNSHGQVEICFTGDVPREDQLTMFGISHLIWDRARFLLLSIPILLYIALPHLVAIYELLSRF